MQRLSAMKLRPYYKEAIWGGTHLGRPGDTRKIGEAYLLSSSREKPSYLRCEQPFWQYLKAIGRDERTFPLLLKAIDTAEILSVQVHPPVSPITNYKGKDELWLISAADGEAPLVYAGLKREVDDEELLWHCRRGSILSLLNPIPVKSGDALFIPGGMIHAVGGGISLFEIQQNHDVTYRFFDFYRGRSLQQQRGCGVLDHAPSKPLQGALTEGRLFADEKDFPFDAEVIAFCGELSERETKDTALLFLEGCGSCTAAKTIEVFRPGDCFFVPGESEYTLSGSGTMLRLPAEP